MASSRRTFLLGALAVALAPRPAAAAIYTGPLIDAHSHAASYLLRRYALDYRVPYFTTIAGAEAAAEAIEYLARNEFEVRALQDYEAPPLP